MKIKNILIKLSFIVATATLTSSVALAETSLTAIIVMAKNFSNQHNALFKQSITSGSALNRGRLWFAFCSDAACQDVKEMRQAKVLTGSVDANGYYVYMGWPVKVKVDNPPQGNYFVQAILDTQISHNLYDASYKNECKADSPQTCLGDGDVRQSDVASIDGGIGNAPNPAAASKQVQIMADQVVDMGTVYMGNVYFSGKQIWQDPEAGDDGKLLVATSNDTNSSDGFRYRNLIKILDLDWKNAKYSKPQPFPSNKYIVQDNGKDYLGDICGLVEGKGSNYLIGVDAVGAKVFSVDKYTGLQNKPSAVASINHVSKDVMHYPCKGVYKNYAYSEEATLANGQKKTITVDEDHLYLISFKGAGGKDNTPAGLLYYVDVKMGTIDVLLQNDPKYPTSMAWRGLAIPDNSYYLVAYEQSFSQESKTKSPGKDRLYLIPFKTEAAKVKATIGTNVIEQNIARPLPAIDATKIVEVKTNHSSDDKCGSTGNYPSTISSHKNKFYVGHDKGISEYSFSGVLPKVTDIANQITSAGTYNLKEDKFIDLVKHGRHVSDIKIKKDDVNGDQLFAIPHCKADNTIGGAKNNDFSLPNGAAQEYADRNLIAVYNLKNGNFEDVADINGDGSKDQGIDLDYLNPIKQYIRKTGNTLPIPPVVFTAPYLAVSKYLVFVGGRGIQGNGKGVISSSGLGQVQDIGVYSIAKGTGYVFRKWMPFFDGLSAEAGKGRGIWGLELGKADEENSTSVIHYMTKKPVSSGLPNCAFVIPGTPCQNMDPLKPGTGGLPPLK